MTIMSSPVLTLLLVTITLVTAQTNRPIFKVGPNITVTAQDSGGQYDFPSAAVIRSCGRGAVINWKLEGCVKGKSNPGKCVQVADNRPIRYKLEFVSENNINVVGVGFTLTINGGKVQFYKETLYNSTVERLNTYDVLGSFKFPKRLRGANVTIGHLVYAVTNGTYSEEVCAETDLTLN